MYNLSQIGVNLESTRSQCEPLQKRRGVTTRTTATSFIIHQWRSRIRHVTRWLPCGLDHGEHTRMRCYITAARTEYYTRTHTHFRVQIFSFGRTGIISKVDTTYKTTSLNAIFYMTFSAIQPFVQNLSPVQGLYDAYPIQLLSTRS